MRLEQLNLDEWGSALPNGEFEVFHTPQALAVLDEHTEATMRLYGAFKGQEPVGLLPLFVKSSTFGRTAMSPPPSMAVPRLGPLVVPSSPKQRKRESVYREFVDLVFTELDIGSARSLVRLKCPLDYEDPRPFQWSDLNVEHAFTYVLDLSDTTPDAVLGGFSSYLRKEIRRSRDTDITISIEGADAAELVYEDVADKYAEQGVNSPADREFVRDLVVALDESARVYVARDGDGEYLGGIIVLYSDDTAWYWQGGVASTHEGISVNVPIHWAIISDVLADDGPDVSRYDLVGANTPNLCKFKAKFGGDLVPYYVVESSGIRMSIAKWAYSVVNK